jgi:DNA mismatch repair protein MutL
MGKIKTLRADVYKKIAAGEVVERPLSVVKELVENAVDAGADAITVSVMEGGKQLIKVMDNGCGFDPEDIPVAFKNHSTSKITELADFDSLNTLGFRGEALPSIMEVSKIEVKTSNNTDGRGVYRLFEDGEIIERTEIAHPKGTTITVKELFYNFPVRRKFLKTERTELNQIISLLEPMSLVNFDKSFALEHNGKTVFSYKKTNALNDRIYQVFGKEFLGNLQPVNYEEGGYKLSGFISKLNTGLSVKKHQYYFVNCRSVREKTLIAALNNTFKRYLEKYRSPAAVLLLEVPPQEIDVNIHPMKLEIKFVNSSQVYQFIKRGIDSCFGTGTDFEYVADFRPSSRSTGSSDWGGSYQSGGGIEESPSMASGRSSSDYGSTESRLNRNISPGQADQGYGAPRDDFEQTQLFSGHFLDEDDFTIIGQYKNSYIIVEKDGELLIVDQHNAQERVNFDQLKKEYLSGNVVTITPLFPVIIDLTPSEASLLDEGKLEIMRKLGFRLEPLTGNSYDIKSFPQVLGEKNIKDGVRTLIHMKEKQDDVSFEDSVLAEIACKSAIKINHKLYPDQMKTIVRNLFKTTNPHFCPHKRPIIIEFTLEKIEKLMKRR